MGLRGLVGPTSAVSFFPWKDSMVVVSSRERTVMVYDYAEGQKGDEEEEKGLFEEIKEGIRGWFKK